MSGSLLDYIVQGKKDYVLQEGDMATLDQKAYPGFIMNPVVDHFDLMLKLKTAAVVWSMEISPINAKTAAFQLLTKDGDIIEEMTNIFDHSKVALIEFAASKNIKRITAKIKVTICIDNEHLGGVGLKYLIVRGDKVDSKSLMQKANVSRKPEFFDARDSPHSMGVKSKETGAVFSERRKNKGQKGEKLERGSEEEDLRRAIELSKLDAQKKGHIIEESNSIPWEKKKEERPKREEKKEMREEKEREERPRDYALVDFQKIKQYFTNVNSTWLEAQRKLEIQKGIEEKYRLSKHIQVRHFNGKTLCIDLPPAKKPLVKKIAEDMGAKIVDDVVDNCLLVTNRNDTEKVAKARKCKNVRIVTPNFLDECKQCDAYLSERDYFLKL